MLYFVIHVSLLRLFHFKSHLSAENSAGAAGLYEKETRMNEG